MVKLKKFEIEWTDLAKNDLKEILTWYKKRSQQGYKLVRQAIFSAIDQAAKSPTSFVVDDLKHPIDNSVRTFTVYHTRVAYYISKNNKITVLRLRHTSREPLEYK